MDPLPAWLQKLWDAWDIRVLVLGSLILQITLIYFGNRRKNIRGIWIDALVWSAYVMADAIAIFSLAKLFDASGGEDSCDNDKKGAGKSNGLMVLWAPILLLHLGGPDTITAYSIEDVRLWLRHVLTLVFQVSIAMYVFLRFWTGKSEWVALLTLPLFVAGIVKYSERTWVLWCTNSAYPKLLLIPFNDTKVVDELNNADGDFSDAKLVGLSYLWLQAMAPSILRSGGFNEELVSSEVTNIIWDTANVNKAFKFFEIQLGFVRDALYTKANKIYSKTGCVVRLVSLLCVASAFLGFIIVRKHDYSPIDVTITYVLLVGAVVLELYAILLIVSSDFAIVWMCKHCKNPVVRCVLRTLAPLVVGYSKRWACSLPTLNVLNLAFYEVKPFFFRRVLRYFDWEEMFKAYRCQIDVYELKLESLKLLVMREVRILFTFFSMPNNRHRFYAEKGELALDRHQNHRHRLIGSVDGQDMDISIVIWHIATTCCYYIDNELDDPEKRSLREGSKMLSDYMMYLLVNYPSMVGENVSACNLSAVLGSYVQLREDAKKEWINDDIAAVCRRMMKHEPNVCTPGHRGGSAESSPSLEYARIPMDACDLATTLMGECNDDKWVIISEIWAEKLFHGAVKCEPTQYLRILPKGGEFISQVWLLLFINGLSYPSPRNFLRPLLENAVNAAEFEFAI